MILKDEKLLRRLSDPITVFEEGKTVADTLLKELLLVGGHTKALGLSAPQIGILKRVFITWGSIGETGVEGWNTYINPILEEVVGDKRIFFVEGCLSFPGSTVRTNRASEIVVSFLEEDGERHEHVLTDIDAIVFQHELDHLNGILMFDRVAKSVPQEANMGKNKIERNDPCPCGKTDKSGRPMKYKKCCGK